MVILDARGGWPTTKSLSNAKVNPVAEIDSFWLLCAPKRAPKTFHLIVWCLEQTTTPDLSTPLAGVAQSSQDSFIVSETIQPADTTALDAGLMCASTQPNNDCLYPSGRS
jgi:hypothetical protein